MFTAFFVPADEADRMKPFKWLIGNWTMQQGEGMITENWKEATKQMLTGESSFIQKDGTVKPFETMQLVFRKKTYYYIAKAAGQNNEEPVAFKITAYSDMGFIAENPEHDFPKRIIYKLVSKDSIHATVDGGVDNPQKKSDYYYSRKKE